MKLSVCITTYNLGNVIDETLQSVMAQKIDFDIEILIGDDGSQDGTLERIKSWKEKYPDLISCYVMPREAGVTYNSIIRASHNRLNLLKHAQGEYITFLDGDDVYNTDDFYQKAVEVLEKPENRDCALCGGSTLMYFPDGTVKPLLMSPWKSGKKSADEYWRSHYSSAEAIIMRNNIEIPDAIEKMFDDNLIVFMGLQRGNIFCLPEAVVKYRQNAKGTNYLSKPLVERCLYEIPSAEAELSVAPHMKEAILYRHRYNIATVNQYSREVTAERYPDVYAFAQDINSHALLKLFSDVQQERKTRKIRVVFLIYRPQIWMSLKSVFEACLTDDRFEVIIVAIPVVEYLTRTQIKVMSEGAEAFFKDFPCQVINGFDYEKKSFYDIHKLQPDYVFYGQPYNSMLPPIYNSAVVCQYTKICFVPYGFQIIGEDVEDSVYNADFLRGVYFFFSEATYRKTWLMNHGRCIEKLKPENIIYAGFPRFDNLDNYAGKESTSWKLQHAGRLRILWLPRWVTEENNCNFFRYRENVLQYAENHLDDIELLFRPHPEMWNNFRRTGEMTVEEQETYRSKYQYLANASIDEQPVYTETLYSSDVFLADSTSLLAECFLTGKPIVFCHNQDDHFTEFGKEIAQGYYVANDWEEVESYLEMLHSGHDPLRSRRQKIIQTAFQLQKKPAGVIIKEMLKNDFDLGKEVHSSPPPPHTHE